MLPDISDSFTSGQPLYLLYENANCAPLLPARFAAALAAQATGSVRLQVTARPPTTKGSAAAAEVGHVTAGSAAAASAPPTSCRRWTLPVSPIPAECKEGPLPKPGFGRQGLMIQMKLNGPSSPRGNFVSESGPPTQK